MCRTGRNFSCGVRSKVVNESANPDAIRLGNNVEIDGSLCVQGEGRLSIGCYSTIRFNSIIESAKQVQIGSFVIISNNVVITDNNNHPTCPLARAEMLLTGFSGDAWHWRHADSDPVQIEDHVWIGRNAVILKGVQIGTGSIVACNAVVTKSVPPFSIVAGNPAKNRIDFGTNTTAQSTHVMLLTLFQYAPIIVGN